MGWVVYVVTMRNIGNAFKILVGKPINDTDVRRCKESG